MSSTSDDSLNQSKQIPVRVAEKTARDNREQLSQLLSEDRFWASLAHAMGPLMFILGLMGDGPAWIFPLMATAAIYLYHQNKSDLVRHHARQALALQVLGSFGWIALVLSGTAIWIIALMISIVLILALVGLLLTPIVLIAGPLLFLASLLLPLSVLVMGTVGAWEVWQGRDFRYPYIANWVDKYLGQSQSKTLAVV